MTTARRRIGVVTVSRSDYGHLRSVLDGIRRAPDLELPLPQPATATATRSASSACFIERPMHDVAGAIRPNRRRARRHRRI